jgi:hypothetical protein
MNQSAIQRSLEIFAGNYDDPGIAAIYHIGSCLDTGREERELP